MVLGIPMKYILIYFLAINLIGFLTMWYDKHQAKSGNWRVPEKTLFMLTFLGGGFGTIAGMYTFRHKTKKMRFVIGFPTILISEICLMIYLALYGKEKFGALFELFQI